MRICVIWIRNEYMIDGIMIESVEFLRKRRIFVIGVEIRLDMEQDVIM